MVLTVQLEASNRVAVVEIQEVVLQQVVSSQEASVVVRIQAWAAAIREEASNLVAEDRTKSVP